MARLTEPEKNPESDANGMREPDSTPKKDERSRSTGRSARTAADKPAPRGLARVWMLMHRGDSVGWVITTTLQALLTWAFIGIAEFCEGMPWETQAKTLVIVGICATWGMALTTIRVRLIELLRFWHRASQKALQKANSSGIQEIPGMLASLTETYVKKSMLRLRIIAAGITLPFLIMPLFTAAVCISLTYYKGYWDTDLLAFAMFLTVTSAVVFVYFRWSILPMPATARTPVRRPVSRRRMRS